MSVRLLATLHKNFETNLHEIFREGWQWANEQMIRFGSDPDHRLNTGLFSGFVTIGRYGKWLTDINLLLILIRQMAALVKRALAEIRTVPVLPVSADFVRGHQTQQLRFVFRQLREMSERFERRYNQRLYTTVRQVTSHQPH